MRTWGIQLPAGRPLSRLASDSQVSPPLTVRWSWPSSEDAQISSGRSGCGVMQSKVVWFSAFVASIVRPPLSACFCFSGSLVVKSGDRMVHDWPRSAL